jgi:hypothetical protein
MNLSDLFSVSVNVDHSGSNAGTGLGIYKQTVSDEMVFRSLKAGADISITSGADEVTVAYSGGGGGSTSSGSNLGTGTGIYKETVGSELNFRSLIGGTNIELISGTNEITISGAAGGGAGGVSGKYIDAADFVATSTAGAVGGLTELATNDIMVDYFDFDPNTVEHIQWRDVLSAYGYSGGNITVTFYYTNNTASGSNAGDIVWGAKMLAVPDAYALDSSGSIDETVTDTIGVSGDLNITSATSGFIPAGYSQAGDLVILDVFRRATAAEDTLAADARLIGVKLDW